MIYFELRFLHNTFYITIVNINEHDYILRWLILMSMIMYKYLIRIQNTHICKVSTYVYTHIFILIYSINVINFVYDYIHSIRWGYDYIKNI